MNFSTFTRRPGFTLLETVIAIGVLAVLLTGFMVVFAPAAAGIRKSINVQEAERLTSVLEQELVTLRTGQGGDTTFSEPAGFTNGFNKSFYWVKNSNAVKVALLVYQYRGEIGGTLRSDGTPKPVVSLVNKQPGKDYVVVPMCRRVSDSLLTSITKDAEGDLSAIEGGVYLVKCTQLVFDTTNGQLKLGTAGKIFDPKGTTEALNPDVYPEAVIAFTAEFYSMPGKTAAYFASTAFTTKLFPVIKTPVFTRNLAVRR